MRMPDFNVGDRIAVPTSLTAKASDDPMYGIVIFPIENESYFARLDNGGFCIVPNTDSGNTRQTLARLGAKVVFMGNGDFGIPTLEMLNECYDLKAVVTMPDPPSGRGRNPPVSSPVKKCAKAHGALTLQPHSLTDARFLEDLDTINPDFIVVADFKILPKEIVRRWTCVNLHSSLLPMYRGASPVTAAVRNADVYSGTTAFVIDEGIDTGRVICNLGTTLNDADDACMLSRRLAVQGALVMDEALQRLMRAERTVAQDDISDPFIIAPSYCRKLRRADYMIPWTKNAAEVEAFILSCSPIPGAWTRWRTPEGDPVTLHIAETRVTDIPSKVPGEVVQRKDGLHIGCADYLLKIVKLKKEGKRTMDSRAFLNGVKSSVGGYCHLPLPTPISKRTL